MRRNFAEILADTGVDHAAEYRSLHKRAFQRFGFYNYVADWFESISFRGTCVNIEDFNSRYGFDFEGHEESDDLDYLLGFCEYLLNFALALKQAGPCDGCVEDMMRHLDIVIDRLKYKAIEGTGGLYKLVPRDERVFAAAEVAPESVATELLEYDYRKNDGNLEAKRAILRNLSFALESKQASLREQSKKLEDNLFCLVNNLSIRHDNTSPDAGGKLKPAVASMTPGELEEWYDLTHRMCCAAFLLLDHADRSGDISDLKESLGSGR